MASTSLVVRDYRSQIPGELSADRRTWNFPLIKSINANGKNTYWQIIVRIFSRDFTEVQWDNRDQTELFDVILDEYFDNKPMDPKIHAWILVLSRTNDDGKTTKKIPTEVSKGKNEKSSARTNVFCQALRDALSTYNKQLKKTSTVRKTKTAFTFYPPMLAKVLSQQKKPLVWAEKVFVQKKYNGVRFNSVLVEDPNSDDGYSVIMYSRKGHLYPGRSYLKDELKKIHMEAYHQGYNIYLDGEAYRHEMPLQDISGIMRRDDEPGDPELDAVTYDMFDPDLPDMVFEERKKLFDEIFEKVNSNTPTPHVINADTYQVTNMEEITEYYKKFIADNYEGAMVRTNSPYMYSYNDRRSNYLLKAKPTLDAEFEVVGWTFGRKGKAKKSIMVICKTNPTPEEIAKGAVAQEFPVTPALEIEEREKLAARMDEKMPNGKTYFENEWLGKKIIVYYDEVSKNFVPQRGRTKLEKETIKEI